MPNIRILVLNFVFFLQILLLACWWWGDRMTLPVWLDVVGRVHPLLVHLPIGLLVFGALLMLSQQQFKKKAFRKILRVLLTFISITASLSALFGFSLSQQSDYSEDSLFFHRLSGMMLSIVCYGLLTVFERVGKITTTFYVVGCLAVLTMVFTGHTGGTITHGENYLFGGFANEDTIRLSDGSVYQEVVYPILQKKCSSCHNEAKAKGKLVMTEIGKFKKGGKHGPEWVEGRPGDSRMITYIHLPLQAENHMPPDGKPQLTNQEMAVLALWIKSGASFTSRLTELTDKDSLKILANGFLQFKSLSHESKQYGFSPASGDLVNKLNTPFCSLFPLYQGSPALQADFYIRESFQLSSLQPLKEVADQLVILNLSKMPITDQDIALIGDFVNLEKLNLNFTDVKGPGLSSLKQLKQLTSLSLVGTQVDTENLKPVLELPALKEIFIWNTRITEGEREQLSQQYPHLAIITTQFTDDNVLRLSKPGVINDGILKKDEPLVLKNAMPGVTIRYALEDGVLDSMNTTIYTTPLKLTGPVRVKAMACKQGWYCSDVFETTCFVEGMRPLHAELLLSPDKKYPGEGGNSLIDGRKGFLDVFNEPSWLGYRDQPLDAGFDFGPNPPIIRSIAISYARSTGSHIFPPQRVEVWAGSSKNELNLIQMLVPDQPTSNQPQRIDALNVPLPGQAYSYYRLRVTPIAKLPPWHSGKGKKGWVMVDEVFFY